MVSAQTIALIGACAVQSRGSLTGRKRTQGVRSVVFGLFPDVRLSPNSDQKADVANWSRGANGDQNAVQQPLAYSIVASASNRIEFGIARFRAFAVFMLITNSNLLGCWTGKSAGFSPFKILPA